MAKKSKKRPVQYEKDHSGCLWGLVSIFDFRHGRTTRKLITDRRHGSRHSGAGFTRNRFELLNNLGEKCQEALTLQGGQETSIPVAGDGKPSVKELMEVEMVGEQDKKKEISSAKLESKESNSVREGEKKKNRKRRTKSWSKSGNIEADILNASENLDSDSSCIQKSGKQSVKDLNIDNMMEEFFHQMHQRTIGCHDHDQNGEGVKLDEAIKEFISQKVKDHKQLTDGNNDHSKELMDAFQILSVDEELFLKLIKDANSPLVKYIRNWQDAHTKKNGRSDSLPGSNSSEPKSGNIRKSEELVNHKRRNFFRRKVKSDERSLLTEDENISASKRIVILKPGPTSPGNFDIDSSMFSSSEPHNIVPNKGTSKKPSSNFSFTKFRGKLRNAMGKERHAVSSDSAENRLQDEHQRMGHGDRRNSCDNIGKSSPGKDHFFIERFAKPSTSLKRGDKGSKGKDCDITSDRQTVNHSGKNASNIYIEAKKHLSEMLSSGDENVGSSSRHVPKTLGRILSLPEYNLSPINSPKTDLGYRYDMAATGQADKEQLKSVNTDTECRTEENKECHTGQSTPLDVEKNVSIDDPASKMQSVDSTPTIINDIVSDTIIETPYPVMDEVYSEGGVEVKNRTIDVCMEDSGSLDSSCQPSNSSIGDNQYDDSFQLQESHEDNRMLSPESSSPLSPCSNKNADEKEAMPGTQERPSPVSVLEPFFQEDDISPAATICYREKDLPVQPIRIQFEEHESYAIDDITHPNACDKESVYEYVNEILQASCLKWDELYMRSLSSDQLLDPSLLDGLELCIQLHHDRKLMFDITNEVVMEVYECYFGCSPWVTFVRSGIRPLPNQKNAINEVWKGVCWHLIQLQVPCTLDQIVRKDLARSESWLDLRFDTENIGFGIGEEILEDLVEETILSCLTENFEEGLALPVGSTEKEASECES